MATDLNAGIPDYEPGDGNTRTFHIDAFRKEWLSRLQPSDYSYPPQDENAFHANFAHELGVSVDMMRELKDTCNTAALHCYPEDQCPDPEVVPEDSTLKTLIERKKHQDHKLSLKISKNRHELYADEQERSSVAWKPEEFENLVSEGDVILTINVYYPAIFEKFVYVRPHVTLLVLGSQSLVKLRDAICCASDLQVCGEFSNTPEMAQDFISKDHYKSAFFFFEGVFYNDMRYPECCDISRTTIKWAKDNHFPSYRQAKMEDTKFEDLKVKVGFPYLYNHQGDCEHVVIISDVRLTHKDDCLDRKLYPLLTHKHRVAVQKCAVCYTFIARWCTTGDQFAPSNPCLFCDKCFRMLHYDKDANKLGDFLAYPYVDRGAFN
ncbi:snRNA-activating protein complex subunit 3-like [Entelurus aequoreus]|uniref:snRNA-activating protein complex subunit 3 n=1 Tax=Entelurus aequoreus TaxID=161455 RepID=UPI002B1D64A1|nr:snRNA-activating protein complex subunit 3 [Entelurus aequoreus]XP_061888950.1 snRNA-activating protein complex subunit 3-like [Entelurus aequoreus]